jgi:hypothetical protein
LVRSQNLCISAPGVFAVTGPKTGLIAAGGALAMNGDAAPAAGFGVSGIGPWAKPTAQVPTINITEENGRNFESLQEAMGARPSRRISS